jgi:hypothetical protein
MKRACRRSTIAIGHTLQQPGLLMARGRTPASLSVARGVGYIPLDLDHEDQ